jgi:hypothetical protein
MLRNWQILQDKLLAAQRCHAPDDQVPAGFTRRVIAHLPARQDDLWDLWAAALWRPAFGYVAFAVLVTFWLTVLTPSEAPHLTEIYDATVYSVTEQLMDNW